MKSADHENKENKILWKEQQMKTNTNIGFELWYRHETELCMKKSETSHKKSETP